MGKNQRTGRVVYSDRLDSLHLGTEEEPEVAKHFVQAIVDISKRVEELLKTNRPIIMTEEECHTHNTRREYELYKVCFPSKNPKVADYNHILGKFCQALSNNCILNVHVGT